MSSTSDLLLRVRADVSQASRALSQLGSQLKQPAAAFGKTSGLLGNTGALILGFGGVGTAAAAAFGHSIKASEEFNDAFADVIRTVNDAQKVGGFGKLKTDIIELSKTIPVTATELANIAAQGGQMNVPADQLVDFTRVVATMGKGTQLGTQQAAEGLGKLANITGEHDWERLASEIVAVGNVNVGGVSQLLDVSQRIALVGHQMGLGIPEILAIGGALGDAGIEAEMGGSAISRIFLKMQQDVMSASRGVVLNTKDVRDAMQRVGDIGEDLGLAQEQRGEMFTKRGKLKKGVSKSSLHAADLRIARLKREQGDAQSDATDLQHPGQKSLEAWAEMANMSTDQFQADWRMSPYATLQHVLGGMHGKSSEEQSGLLDKAGINNIRDIETMAGLAANPGHMTELFGAAQDNAANPTALANVAKTKFGADNTAAQQKMLANAVEAVYIAAGDKFAPAMIEAEKQGLKLLEDSKGLQDVFSSAPDWMKPFTDVLDKAGIGMDKLVIGAMLFQGINGAGLLAGLFKGGAGLAKGAAGAASGASGGLGSLLGSAGLAAAGTTAAVGAIAAGTLLDPNTGVIGRLLAGKSPFISEDELKNWPSSRSHSAPITVNVGDVIHQGGDTAEQVWESIKAQFVAAFNAAHASQPVQGQLGGAYTP